MPKLFVLGGKDVGRVVEFDDVATLGRGVDCTVRLRDPSVSRNHARVERAGEGWRLVDAGSRNGVRVDGKKVTTAALGDGTTFLCGEVELRFRSEDDETLTNLDAGDTVTRLDRQDRADAAPAAAPRPPAAPVEEDFDEIVLEEPDDDEPAPAPKAPRAPQAPPAPAPPPKPAAAQAARPAGSPRSPGSPRSTGAAARPARPQTDEPVSTSRGVLQYNRVPDREGFFAADLGQQPAWVKLLVSLLVTLVFAGLGWAAFKGTTFLRGRGQDTSLEALEDE